LDTFRAVLASSSDLHDSRIKEVILLDAITWMLKKALGESNRSLRCLSRKLNCECFGCGVDGITSGKDLVVEITDVR
jgi:hypothetical protein